MKTPIPTRRGAALLIVIGLLALLLISTVAFSILMTIERNAAANYRHSVQARQLLYAGLAQALSDIDADLSPVSTNYYYPPWTTGTNTITITTPVAGTRNVYYTAEVLQSVDTNALIPCFAKVVSATAMKYIPQSLYQAVQTVQPEYLALSDANNNTIGRCAYVAVNVSGLLDASVVGATNRALGMSPSEIQVDPSLLSEVIDANQFKTGRTTYQRYESLADLAAQPKAITGIDPTKLSNFETFSYAPDTDLAPDGHPKLYIGGDIASRLTDATPYYPNETDNFSNRLVKVLSSSYMLGYTSWHGFPPGVEVTERVNNFISCMLDYTSANTLPRNMAGPKIKSGEYHIRAVEWTPTITYHPNTPSSGFGFFTVAHNFTVCAYNYSGPNGCTYVATVRVVPYNLPQMTAPAVLVNTLNAVLQPTVNPPPITTWVHSGSDMYGTIPTNFAASGGPGVSGNFIFGNAGTRTYAGLVEVSLSNVTTGVLVDQVPANWADTNNAIPFYGITLPTAWNGKPVTILQNSTPPTVPWFAEAFDPRLNWSGNGNYGQWILSSVQSTICPGISPALLSANNFAFSVLTQPLNFYGNSQNAGHVYDSIGQRASDLGFWNDAWSDMTNCLYCPNRPFQSVGELAYIPIDIWQTPRIFDHGDNPPILGAQPNLPNWSGNNNPSNHYCRIFDYFTMSPPPASLTQVPPKRGLININTRTTNVLASAFLKMPIHDWSSAPDPGLNAAQALFLAQTVSGFIQTNQYVCGQATNASVLGMLPYTSAALTTTLGMRNEMDRKAVMRNSMSLFTARQQIYTIIVRADAISTAYGGGASGPGNPLSAGSALGSAQGVFQVWRDPVADANGKHPCFVRLCKILSL